MKIATNLLWALKMGPKWPKIRTTWPCSNRRQDWVDLKPLYGCGTACALTQYRCICKLRFQMVQNDPKHKLRTNTVHIQRVGDPKISDSWNKSVQQWNSCKRGNDLHKQPYRNPLPSHLTWSEMTKAETKASLSIRISRKLQRFYTTRIFLTLCHGVCRKMSPIWSIK